MKGPGGILLIGVGVFVIALGWTGAYAKVAEVLTGKLPGVDLPTVDLPTIPDQPKAPTTNDKACQSDPHCPVGEKCFGGVCISTEEPGNDNICGSGRELVSISSTGKKRCALSRDLASPEGGQCRPGYIQVARSTEQESTLLCWKRPTGAGESMRFVDFPSRHM
jgi:hypothetical protein